MGCRRETVSGDAAGPAEDGEEVFREDKKDGILSPTKVICREWVKSERELLRAAQTLRKRCEGKASHDGNSDPQAPPWTCLLTRFLCERWKSHEWQSC